MTDKEFYRHALGVLQWELDPDGVARSMRLNSFGGGGYTRDRKQRLNDDSPGDVFQPIPTHRPGDKRDARTFH